MIFIFNFTFCVPLDSCGYFICLFEVLRPSQQLRSCRSASYPLIPFLGRLRPSKRLTSIAGTPPVVTNNYRWVITADTTIFQYCPVVTQEMRQKKRKDGIDEMKKKRHAKTAHPSRTCCKHSRPLPYYMPKK